MISLKGERLKVVRKPKASETMRIDLHPDFEAIGDNKQHVTVYESADTSLATIPARKSGADSAYSRLLTSIYDGVFITDMSGYIMDYNARAASMFAPAGNELSGTNVIDRIQGVSQEVLGTIRVNLTDSRHTIIDANCTRIDNSLFPAEIAVSHVEIDGNEGMSFFIRDITVRKIAQTALEDAVARLEEHDRQKSQFVSNVSHELRTPLTSMIYAVTNLLRGVAGPLTEPVEKYLNMMDGDCKRLLGTVNDILDLRKMDNKELVLAKARFKLARFATSAVESLRVSADLKGINIRVVDSGDASKHFVECDPLKLERVIINIVGNALKFTSSGGEIEVTFEDDPEHPGYVRFSVRDDGKGIPANMIEHVTKRYFTVGDQASGTGLGLSLSKEIVEYHGGGMGIASPPPGHDKGTMVSVVLPVAEAPSVLVVDDEDDILQLFKLQLEAEGYRVLAANSGAMALEMLEDEKPDIMVLDLIMPEMDGTEVVVKMKSDVKTMGIPIIVVTGGNLSAAKAAILNAYSIPAMSKPWKEDEFFDKLHESFLGKATLK